MNRLILWIEDDYYAIKGLVRPLEKAGFVIEVATSASEAYSHAQNWRKYDLFVVDLILPISPDDNAELPEEVKTWENEPHVGLGIAKWLVNDLHVKCPILLLSVVRNPITNYNLADYGLTHYLSKEGLLPSRVKLKVFSILGIQE